MAKLEIGHLCAEYQIKKRGRPVQNVRALNDFSLQIEDGELIVITGPSGCGKTTLLRAIAGLQEYSGCIRADGADLASVPAYRRNFSMVFQESNLYPHLTAFENMAFGLQNQKLPREEIVTRIEAAAKTLDIEYLLNRRPKRMSLGQRQRVALGRAVVRNPDVLLLDEPFSNLDAPLRAELCRALLDLHSKYGTTTVFVTHEQAEAIQLGDRIAVMRQGRLEEADTPDRLLRFPRNVFVASFFGQPELQPVRCRLEKSGETYSLRFQNGGQAAFCPDSERLSGYIGKEVLFGIRPDDILELPNGRGNMTGVAALVENRANRYYVHVQIGGDTLIAASMSGLRLGRGSEVSLHADLSRVMLFDAGTGECILHGAGNCV